MASVKTFILQCFSVYGWVYLLSTILGIIIAGIAIGKLILFIYKNNRSENK